MGRWGDGGMGRWGEGERERGEILTPNSELRWRSLRSAHTSELLVYYSLRSSQVELALIQAFSLNARRL
ncbi:MAG: hypothetical protein KME17_29780 [Cyanosarcina radialis HA8281-LM2]|nr:hypothetical protein [Cyanosarcina radialis HA8281-LM2]